VEAIALDAGVPPRTLQEFISIHRWAEDALRTRLQHRVQQQHGDENAIGLIDETGFVKKGDKTAGVQRQYCGATGKKDNCVVSVQMGYATRDFHAVVDGDLYLPESWCSDPDRRREAGVPDTVQFRTKQAIAIDILRRAISNGMRFRYLTADELYGHSTEFRREVTTMGLICVVEIPCSVRGWLKRPAVRKPSAAPAGSGRPRRKASLAPGAEPCRRVDDLSQSIQSGLGTRFTSRIPETARWCGRRNSRGSSLGTTTCPATSAG